MNSTAESDIWLLAPMRALKLLDLHAQLTAFISIPAQGNVAFRRQDTLLYVGGLHPQNLPVCWATLPALPVNFLDRLRSVGMNLFDPYQKIEILRDHFFLAASSARAPLRMSSIA
jgi:hypothetical protein